MKSSLLETRPWLANISPMPPGKVPCGIVILTSSPVAWGVVSAGFESSLLFSSVSFVLLFSSVFSVKSISVDSAFSSWLVLESTA